MNKQSALQDIYNNSYYDELEKISEEQPGWWARQRGISRAMTDEKNRWLVNPELRKKTFEKSLPAMGKGALIGGGVGAGGAMLAMHTMGLMPRSLRGKFGVAGAGLALGALTGADIGESTGHAKAQEEYLRDRGIEIGMTGLNPQFTRKAIKKYIIDKKRG